MRAPTQLLATVIVAFTLPLMACKTRSTPVSATFSDAKPAQATSEVNVTAEYMQTRALLEENLAQWENTLKTSLSRYRIILVPGLLSNEITAALSATIWRSRITKDWVGTYFGEQIKVLDRLGLKYQIAPLSTIDSVRNNAARLRPLIKASTEPVILIGHSKGGIDALEALLDPKIRAKVAAFVTWQAPIRGIPIQDLLNSSKVVEKLMRGLLSFWGGSPDVVTDLAVKDRKEYLERNSQQIAALTAEIPCLSFGTFIKPTGIPNTFLFAARDFYWLKKSLSDGVVPIESSRGTGTPYVEIDGADHISPVVYYIDAEPFDRQLFTSTVLTMLHHRLRAYVNN